MNCSKCGKSINDEKNCPYCNYVIEDNQEINFSFNTDKQENAFNEQGNKASNQKNYQNTKRQDDKQQKDSKQQQEQEESEATLLEPKSTKQQQYRESVLISPQMVDDDGIEIPAIIKDTIVVQEIKENIYAVKAVRKKGDKEDHIIKEYSSHMMGRCSEYYMLLLGSVFFTIFTLGFGFSWAYVNIKNWQAEHTLIDGKSLKFDGQGSDLFKKILLWGLLTVCTVGIFLFFIPTALNKWTAERTHINTGIDKPHGLSKYKGGVLGWIANSFIAMLLFFTIVGLPWAIVRIERYRINNMVIDGRSLYYEGTGASRFVFAFKAILLSIITLFIYFIVVAGKNLEWVVRRTHFYD